MKPPGFRFFFGLLPHNDSVSSMRDYDAFASGSTLYLSNKAQITIHEETECKHSNMYRMKCQWKEKLLDRDRVGGGGRG